VTVFAKVGMNVTIDGDMSLDDMINEGVRRAYNHPDNVLRASVLADPDGKRANTKDNTPAVINYSIVPGDTLEIDVAAKGGGSEAPWWTGCWNRFPKWAPAGVRRACSASALAAPPRKPC